MNQQARENVKAFLYKYKPFVIMIAMAVIFGMMNPTFIRISNLTNIFRQVATNAILAVGVSFVILTGGIDISVGSVLGFTGAVAVYLIVQEVNIILVVLISLVLGAIIGCVNGFFIAKCRLQPMIVTLATMSIFRGATLVLTDGRPIPLGSGAMAPYYKFIGSGMLFDRIPSQMIIMLVIYCLAFFVLNRRVYGRHVYAVGGNEEAANLSGINVIKTKIAAYMTCGVTAAVGGLIISSRISSAQPTAGVSFEMDAIAAVVIGGTSLRGGQGQVLFSMVGAIIIGMLNNMQNLMRVPSYYQTIVKGVIILIAVLLDEKTKKSG